MKLVVAIVNDDDIHAVLSNLTDKQFHVTKLASTGGFLKVGNTTIICGVEAEKVDEVIEIIKEHSAKREVAVVASGGGIGAMPHLALPISATTGGSTIFVLDVEQFLKV